MPYNTLHKLVPAGIILKRRYKKRFGRDLNLKDPKTFNEKLQWLKLHDRQPIYTKMVDKYEAKKLVASMVGEQYIIPTLGVWNKFDDIDFDGLPDRFVLKCTHDSGSVVICKDKKTFDVDNARKILEAGLKENFYWYGREWPYKNVPRRIIAEKYMEDESGYELKDYKVFCFDGEPKMIQVDYDRFTGHKRNLYTTDWEFINATIEYPNDENHEIERPLGLDTMLDIARKITKGIPHVRADFYSIGSDIYFGELTFYHGGGFEVFTPREFEITMGDWITLPKH